MRSYHVDATDANRTRVAGCRQRCWRWRDVAVAAAARAAAPPRRRRRHRAQRRRPRPGSTSTSGGGGSSHRRSRRAGPSRASRRPASPINIGTIDTHQPGTDFTDGPNMIKAYFNCVNDNGGVNGHPLKLFVELDQTQPAQVAAAAKKLIQSDHVVAIDGVFDLLECTIDQGYWKQLGIYEMDAGIAPECWSTPEQRRGQHGTALQLRRGGAVRAEHGEGQEDRVRAVQRPGHRLHRRRSGVAREGRGRADHSSSPRTCRSTTPTRWRSTSSTTPAPTARWS